MGSDHTLSGTPAVFLDRDGVLLRETVRNGKPLPPTRPEEAILYHNVPQALERLHRVFSHIFVVTNQPDVARGTLGLDVVQNIHQVLLGHLPLTEILVCLHDDRDQCDCRKPKPGLLFKAAQRYHIDLTKSFMVGDRWRDIDAGACAGCTTILVDHRYDERAPEHPPNFIVSGINEAVDVILHEAKHRATGNP